MKHLRSTSVLLVLSLLLSCGSRKEPVRVSSPFRGLDTFFEREIAFLNASSTALVLTLATNGTREKIVKNAPDWNTELLLFTDAVKGKPEWSGAYLADSAIIGDERTVIYTARDETPRIKKVIVYGPDGSPDSLIIIKKTENLYYASGDSLIYYRGGNFTIYTYNHPTAGKSTSLYLEGRSGNPIP